MGTFDYERFLRLAAEARKRFQSPRAQRVLGFLVAKGFLIVPLVLPKPQVKLKIEDVLWVGQHVEPRVLEVLPAALIHYPSSFRNMSKLPQELLEVVRALKAMKEDGPNYGEITYRQFKQATQIPLPDKRIVALADRKIARTYRLKPAIAARIKHEAAIHGLSEGVFIERLVCSIPEGK